MKPRPHLTLLGKCLADSLSTLLLSMALLFAFCWLYVWLISVFDLGSVVGFFDSLPPLFRRLSSIPLEKFTDPAIMLSINYVHPIVLFTMVFWAIARGSNSVSGRIDRGSMEMLIAQPIPRAYLLVVDLTVMLVGALVLAFAALCGTAAGLSLIELKGSPSVWTYLPVAINLFFFTAALIGLSLFCSSWDQNRSRTVGILICFYLAQTIFALTSRMWPKGEWVKYLTLLSAYDPQQIVTANDQAWQIVGQNCLILGSIAVISMLLAFWVFGKRDLPAPL